MAFSRQFASLADVRFWRWPSHETIYRSLFVQARGVLKQELMRHLRSQRAMQRPGAKKWQGDARGQIKDMVCVSETHTRKYWW